jgi:heterodisulfide reductase subunit C
MDSHFGLADKIFYKTGHGVPANAPDQQKWRDLRESYGLPALPPTVHSHPDAVEECQTLMKEVGFRALLDKIAVAKQKEKEKQEAEKEEEEE